MKHILTVDEYLLENDVSERGGGIALSGFYNQFIVTIEYIIGLLKGEWDFVLMEYHDDIIVGKENKVRFIQVKTSYNIKLKIS